MHPYDQKKTTFVTEWGVFMAVVMMFGLKSAKATFQRLIAKIFDDYISSFMKVFLNDLAVHGYQIEHLEHLCLCLERCRIARLSLNLAKCVFYISSGALLGHIVSHDAIAMESNKVPAILNAQAPNPKPSVDSWDRLGGIVACYATWPNS